MIYIIDYLQNYYWADFDLIRENVVVVGF